MGEGVSSEITIRALLDVSGLSEVAEEDADAFDTLALVVALLEGVEDEDAGAVVLNDSVDHGKSPPDKWTITADCVHNIE